LTVAVTTADFPEPGWAGANCAGRLEGDAPAVRGDGTWELGIEAAGVWASGAGLCDGFASVAVWGAVSCPADGGSCWARPGEAIVTAATAAMPNTAPSDLEEKDITIFSLPTKASFLVHHQRTASNSMRVTNLRPNFFRFAGCGLL
jgi:hypothetical protein